MTHYYMLAQLLLVTALAVGLHGCYWQHAGIQSLVPRNSAAMSQLCHQ